MCAYHTIVYPIQRVYLSSNILLSIRYNVYTCHSPIYHYIIVTVVYCVLYHSCVCRGYVIIELVSPKDEVCWKSKNTCSLKSDMIRNTYTRYHICLMRVLIIPLYVVQYITIYITATAVYLTQRFITACVVVM